MSNDPGLANDTCIFMESVTGDNGAHNANGVWWLSPDIELTGPASGPEVADAGQVNTIKVKFHRKSAASNCNFPGDESVTVEVWVADPSLMMAPTTGSAVRVGNIGSPLPAEGGGGTQQIDWIPPAVLLPPDAPASAGPKCLVARCYPDSGLPNATRFFVPGDQHVAQRNLCAVAVETNSVVFKVNTINPLTGPPTVLLPPQVKLRALLDMAPNPFVKGAISKRLHRLTGFQQLRTTPLDGGFKFDLAGFQVSQVIDHSRPNHNPPIRPSTYEARVVLPTKGVSRISFAANLDGVNPGEACIFHLTQTTSNDVAQGGLTLVVLKL